ncbi:exodeoxyribonuclease VII small subunit [Ferrimonas lipolytica]|uniref:Exodeoxyribonuclease 7 small subunit n=1 Tax=Ferrimonas lipolytica TaxID=2724191 RepID=A0A6H1UB48_9GAMM|nr:exodeoxyribonuclease VII small subunit [Ferrimonas lipolytica]QIZ75583.1 exodeoxyribonuclease VII small subunit [Ferrimonas lipolytica]
MAKKPENLSFEQSLQELEQIVANLEHGDVPLEKALAQFERGISLVRASQTKLDSAEQQVSVLTEQQGQPELTPFQAEE